MSEHPPQNQNTETNNAETAVDKRVLREAHGEANYIHKHSDGKGTSTETINELEKMLEMTDEEFEALLAASKNPETEPTPDDPEPTPDDPENPDTPDNPNDGGSPDSPETNPGGEASQESAVDSAREDVEKALEDQEPDPEDPENAEDDPDFEGNNEETVLSEEVGSPEATPTPKEQSIFAEIDAIDKIRDYKERQKKIEEYALKHNGIIGPNGEDIGVEAAKRLNKSSARNVLNPRRYTIRLGQSRRHYNTLLNKMAQRGPNGANLEAAKAMKWNWDFRYRKKEVPGKNETLYKVSEILEKQIATLPAEIAKLTHDKDDLLHKSENPSNKEIEQYKAGLEKLSSARDKSVEKVYELELEKENKDTYKDLSSSEAKAKKDKIVENIKQLQGELDQLDAEIAKVETELDEVCAVQKQRDVSDARKKQEEIDKKTKQLTYSNENTLLVDDAIDPLHLHAHKYKGKIVANRAIQRKDIDILSNIEVPGHLRKRQDALSEIIIDKARQISANEGLSEEQKKQQKAQLLEFTSQNIRNKKIKDKTIKSIV